MLLDSTVLVADPLLTSTAWKVLAHARRRQGLRLCITEVVLLEAIAGYQRRLADAESAFDSWVKKHSRSLGPTSATNEIRIGLAEQGAAYSEQLGAVLDEVPVEVLPFPEISHRTLVERAVARIPPCNQRGDGYRDSLNWFTILEVARSADTTVLWVTNDGGDFADSSGNDFQPALKAELDELDLGTSVRLVRSLRDAAVIVAAETYGATESELPALQDRLAQDTLTTYMIEQLLGDPPAVVVEAAPLALPLGSRSPVLVSVGAPIESDFKVTAPLDGGEAAVEVSILCDTTILFEASPSSTLGPDSIAITDDAGIVAVEITKPIRFSALLRVDRYVRPTGGELTTVAAPADDPGHELWRTAITAGARRLAAALYPQEIQESYRRMAEQMRLPAETVEAFRRMADTLRKTGDAPTSTSEGIDEERDSAQQSDDQNTQGEAGSDSDQSEGEDRQ